MAKALKQEWSEAFPADFPADNPVLAMSWVTQSLIATIHKIPFCTRSQAVVQLRRFNRDWRELQSRLPEYEGRAKRLHPMVGVAVGEYRGACFASIVEAVVMPLRLRLVVEADSSRLSKSLDGDCAPVDPRITQAALSRIQKWLVTIPETTLTEMSLAMTREAEALTPSPRRSTRRCSKRDEQFVAWAGGGLSAKEIATMWNHDNDDDVSEGNVRQILSRSKV